WPGRCARARAARRSRPAAESHAGRRSRNRHRRCSSAPRAHRCPPSSASLPRFVRPFERLSQMTARTMAGKIWDEHVIGDDLLFIDLHLVHEVSSPQAFEGLRAAGRRVRRVDRTLATADHNVPTWDLSRPNTDPISQAQLDALERNVADFGVPYYGLGHARQGIVHVIGPELGLTQPGMTIVCGDSHTSTHGAFGALAFGIGTSEVEHVL